MMNEGYFWPCHYERCLKQPQKGQDLQSWCFCALLKWKWIKVMLDFHFVFLKNFIATILVQCSLTQTTKIQGQKCPWNRRDSGVSVCWITSTDLATLAPFHTKLVWGDGKASEFSEFADQVFYSAAPSDFEVWTPVPQLQVWESMESLLTGTAVLNMRRWVSHYQSLKPHLYLFYALKLSAVLRRLWPHNPWWRKSKGILLDYIKSRFTSLKTIESGIQVENEKLWSAKHTVKKYSFSWMGISK